MMAAAKRKTGDSPQRHRGHGEVAEGKGDVVEVEGVAGSVRCAHPGNCVAHDRPLPPLVEDDAEERERPACAPIDAEPVEVAAADEEPRRADQFQCPFDACRRWGCPVSGGTRRTRAGIVRYRRCGGCGRVFKTFERFVPGTDRGSGREEFKG